jgi:putative Holliday junction resolvase
MLQPHNSFTILDLPTQGKILALDLGSVRTGVAVTDALQRVAFARAEITHSSAEELKTKLSKLIEEEGIVGVLIGLPTKLSGEETEQTQKTRALAISLDLKIPMIFVDERLTSEFAASHLQNPSGLSTKQAPHGPVDSRSAQIMLEEWMGKIIKS